MDERLRAGADMVTDVEELSGGSPAPSTPVQVFGHEIRILDLSWLVRVMRDGE